MQTMQPTTARVPYAQFKSACGESSDYHFAFSGFASDLGLPVLPPEYIEITDAQLGNGQRFALVYAKSGVWHYQQLLGCLRLRLLND